MCPDQFELLKQAIKALSNESLFLTVLEAASLRPGTSMTKIPEGGPLPGLQRAVFLWCPRMQKRELAGSLASFCKSTNPTQERSISS